MHRQPGGLWLATRILNHTLVVVPLRAIRYALFDSAFWQRYSSTPIGSPNDALFSYRSLHWILLAPIAWLLRFIQLQLDERLTKTTLKSE